jgi:restriction endonuclease
MSIPKYSEIMPKFVKCLEDGAIHSLREIREYCAAAFHITDKERQMEYSSGGIIFNDRVSWASTYLKKAGLEACKQDIENITVAYLQQFESRKTHIEIQEL